MNKVSVATLPAMPYIAARRQLTGIAIHVGPRIPCGDGSLGAMHVGQLEYRALMLGPILKGNSLDLEPIRPEDLPLINRWWALPEVNLFWPGAGVPSLRQTEEWYERSARSEDSIVWVLRADGETIGQTFLAGIDWRNRHATSGVMIGETSAWRRGYGSEAVRLRTDYAFGELGLERLESESVAGNLGMHRALDRSGYRKIGRKRRVFYRGGVWQDSFLFELLREEWEARKDR